MKIVLTNISLVFVLFTLTSLCQAAKVEGTGVFEIPAWFKESFFDLREDIAEAAAQNKRVMLFYHQSGCPYCTALVNNNFSQKYIVDYTRKHFDALEMNMWGDREVTNLDGKTYNEKTFAELHKVWFTPTLFFFNEQGKVILRINGYYAPERLMAALRYVAEKQETKTDFRSYYAKLAPPKASGVLHKESYYLKPPYDFSKMSNNKPLMVLFEQRDCRQCDTLHNKILKEKASREQLARLNVVQLDMWSNTPVITPQGNKTTARKWAKSLKITYAPTAVFFDGKTEMIRMEAFLKSFHVQSVMDFAASRAYKTLPNLQRFIQQRAERLLEHGQKVDIWK
ncbi:MAG: hypothetical protein BMS9Abin36_0907 [Gammaproteobacteria bacterium]|nr:MAG: hypothetical protein BMS9Abin36_0907 [Gammaproteobacteria bacterium]